MQPLTFATEENIVSLTKKRIKLNVLFNYADMIIKRLEEAESEWKVNFWLTKGHAHNDYMINNYEIYLD